MGDTETFRYPVGVRVRLSPAGRRATHIFPDLRTAGTVVPPGRTRGGLYPRVRIDGHEPRTFSTHYWEPDMSDAPGPP